ncbi:MULTISPECIES: hypothetical protein [unclassified Streptomyces]|uniref:hypothetical protein n=1 Tax=unclassified Streptomyces TaxID=2593676 RepID=UPI0036638898
MTAPESPQPFLSLHTAVILLTAVMIGIVLGALTLLSGAPAPGAIAAGLTSAGGSVPALRSLIR